LVLALLTLVFVLALSLDPLHIVSAQGAENDGEGEAYQSDQLGYSFRYPSDWMLREQANTQTVLLATRNDLAAVAGGQTPDGLLFSVTISTFRRIGANRLEDFIPILQKIAQTPGKTPTAVRVGDADGLSIDMQDQKENVATRTVILSIGNRRVAVIRGVATLEAWTTKGCGVDLSGEIFSRTDNRANNGAAQTRGACSVRFESILSTFSFFPPQVSVDEDTIGRVLWHLRAPETLTDLVDISVSADGAALYVTERAQGIWQINANGVSGEIKKPAGIGAFGGIAVVRAAQYVADPANNVLWVVDSTGTNATKLLGGEVGSGRGLFGVRSPQYFAFGPGGVLYVLDDNEKGPRIHVYSRMGRLTGMWDLAGVQSTKIDGAVISSDSVGNAYVVGRNMPGIIKVSPTGRVVSTEIGKEVLANTGPLALTVDRFGNFYVATTDQAILFLGADGKLRGVIGQSYDEAGPPKPGQLGKPVAMVLGDAGRVLYVIDSGKYPQIVAFSLTSNTSLNVAAGTRTAGPIIYGQTVSGEINEKTFVDLYTFEGKAGDIITITMVPGDGSQIDPHIDLLRANGQRLAANDDARVPDAGMPKNAARIKSYRLRFSERYTIRATRFGRETTTETGTYSLTLTLEGFAKPNER
jgi:hypothetical protein